MENSGKQLKNYFKRAMAKTMPKVCSFIKKEILAQEFSCEFCKI